MSRMDISLFGVAAFAAAAVAAGAAPAQTPPTYGVIGRIAAPDGGFDYASFDPAHRRVYVSRTGGVLALDVDTRQVVGHLADAQKAHESLPLDSGATLLVTDSGSNSAHLVDALNGQLLADIPAGQKPDAALFDPATGLAMVMNGHSGDVTLIDPQTRKAVGAIPVGGALEFAVADGLGRVFVNIEDQNQIAVLDTRARAVVGRYALKSCEGPTGLAYAADRGVLIAACANKTAKVIRAADGEDLATLAIGAGPDAVIYDAARHLAFIPCGQDGLLEVLDLRAPGGVAIVQSLKTQRGARVGALDPRSGDLYLPTASYAPSPTGGRPIAQPGTFTILVVGPGR